MALSTAVDASAVARVVGIQTDFKNLRGGVVLLPQRIAVIGQGSTASTYSTDKQQVTSASQVGSLYGFGSPVHLAAKQLLPANGDGVGTISVTIYPLDDDGSGVASTGSITPSGAATGAGSYIVRINNIDSEAFTVASGDSVATIVTAMTAAINAVLDMPVTAVDNTTDVALTSKWKGTSANDIYVEVVGTDAATTGVSYVVVQPTGGLVNPDISTATDQIGNVWETMIVNCFESTDTTILDALSTLGEGRWGALVRKPLIAFSGTNESSVTTAIAVPDARKTDRTNCQLVSPGSNDLPLVIAARQVARIAVVANNKPANDYGSQAATGLVPGADGDQWDYPTRDQAVKGGSSTIEVRDSVVTISDVVTYYHPTGEEPPAYRFVKDIVKLQNILFNLDLIFNTAEWNGAPLIPDDQATSNRDAKKPKDAVSAIAGMIDSLGLEAILSDPETAKTTIQAQISETNPNRLDVTFTVQISGNSNIISIDLNFGFFFGTATLVA